jgi:hypothetical protein
LNEQKYFFCHVMSPVDHYHSLVHSFKSNHLVYYFALLSNYFKLCLSYGIFILIQIILNIFLLFRKIFEHIYPLSSLLFVNNYMDHDIRTIEIVKNWYCRKLERGSQSHFSHQVSILIRNMS